jgi:hypothetical protein
MFLRENPWTPRRHQTRADYEQKALRQGHIKVNSILRDYAVECGILSFEAVFMPYMLTNDGRPLIERLAETNLLPAPAEQKVVQLTK